jgi:hypothetical protein
MNITKVLTSVIIDAQIVETILDSPKATLLIEAQADLIPGSISDDLKILGVGDGGAREGGNGANNASAIRVVINVAATSDATR